MNKKGFTLIELLAVIVILAIIALIATPIVLDIINQSKESAQLRSAEMYLDAVEQAVSIEKMNNTNFKPNSCTIEKGNLNCEGYDKNPIEVKVNGEVPETGTISFENGKIKDVTLNYSNDKTIIKNTDGKLVYGEKEESEEEKTLDTICTHDTTNGVSAKTAGAKYSCEVKPGTSYNFYVLTTPAEDEETINLIMDRNICEVGTPATESNECLVAWYNEKNVNIYGPITAMNFLYNATKDWTNIDPVNYTYNDKTTQGTTASNTSYTSFVSTNGVSTITPLTGDSVTIGSEATPLRARMPIYASDASITEVASKTDANAYLYDNLDPDGNAAPYGYWTLSSYAGFSNPAWTVYGDGSVSCSLVNSDSGRGVRAVINLNI